jgi:hypothetical protein
MTPRKSQLSAIRPAPWVPKKTFALLSSAVRKMSTPIPNDVISRMRSLLEADDLKSDWEALVNGGHGNDLPTLFAIACLRSLCNLLVVDLDRGELKRRGHEISESAKQLADLLDDSKSTLHLDLMRVLFRFSSIDPFVDERWQGLEQSSGPLDLGLIDQLRTLERLASSFEPTSRFLDLSHGSVAADIKKPFGPAGQRLFFSRSLFAFFIAATGEAWPSTVARVTNRLLPARKEMTTEAAKKDAARLKARLSSLYGAEHRRRIPVAEEVARLLIVSMPAETHGMHILGGDNRSVETPVP